MPDEPSAIRRVVGALPRVLGAGLNAAITTATGDPVTGAFVGEAFAAVGDDFVDRVLSPREDERVATALQLAAEQVRRRLDNGETPRPDATERDGEEVLEGVLLAARAEFEERKVPYLANFYARWLFAPKVPPAAALVGLNDAESLSWIDLRLLSMVRRSNEFPLPPVDISDHSTDWNDWSVAHSFKKLHDNGFTYSPELAPAGLGKGAVTDRHISAVGLTNRGNLLVDLMDLPSVPAKDVEEVHELLIRAATHGAFQTEYADTRSASDASA